MVQRRHGKLDGSGRVGVERESAGREIRSGRLPASAVSVGCAVVVQPRRTEMDGSGRGDAGGAASAVSTGSMRHPLSEPRRGNWTIPVVNESEPCRERAIVAGGLRCLQEGPTFEPHSYDCEVN